MTFYKVLKTFENHPLPHPLINALAEIKEGVEVLKDRSNLSSSIKAKMLAAVDSPSADFWELRFIFKDFSAASISAFLASKHAGIISKSGSSTFSVLDMDRNGAHIFENAKRISSKHINQIVAVPMPHINAALLTRSDVKLEDKIKAAKQATTHMRLAWLLTEEGSDLSSELHRELVFNTPGAYYHATRGSLIDDELSCYNVLVMSALLKRHPEYVDQALESKSEFMRVAVSFEDLTEDQQMTLLKTSINEFRDIFQMISPLQGAVNLLHRAEASPEFKAAASNEVKFSSELDALGATELEDYKDLYSDTNREKIKNFSFEGIQSPNDLLPLSFSYPEDKRVPFPGRKLTSEELSKPKALFAEGFSAPEWKLALKLFANDPEKMYSEAKRTIQAL